MQPKKKSKQWQWLGWALAALVGGAGAEPPPPTLPPPTMLPSMPGTGPTDVGGPPRMLDRPLESQPPAAAPETADFLPAPAPEGGPLFRYTFDPPLGFAGRSSVLPREVQGDNDFIPLEDRWRLGYPAWDRYGKGHPLLDDYPYDLGRLINPYQLNVLKGDYPILGQNTFFNFTGLALSLVDTRQIPTQTTPFESTARPREFEFFGIPNQLAYNQFVFAQLDLFHGDAAFKPVDWRILITPALNINTLNVTEVAQVSPNVQKGTQRDRSFWTLQEYFLEYKLADTSPYYDFISTRVGSQFFVSDFRGFLFSDVNRAIRLFGTANANRDEFNLALFRQAEKDTNSGLNTFTDRKQTILIGNYFRQDFIFPGYTALLNFHYNHDPSSMKFDRNGFLVRPDPDGTFHPHTLDVVYFGWGGNGHIGRYNLTHQFYWAVGHDTLNPIANQEQDISAQMFAIELSYDRDWARFRTSFFWSSGDHNPNNHTATGFDTILDNPNFAGGQFSYWQRQNQPLFGVNLNQRLSLIPDLRSSKIQGQSNFVNPGLLLFNLGFDMELTPKLKMINNCNFLWFESTQVLQTFLFAPNIGTHIGEDLSTGFEYRPLLSQNVVVLLGVATLIPGGGYKSLYNRLENAVNPPVQAFLQMNLAF